MKLANGAAKIYTFTGVLPNDKNINQEQDKFPHLIYLSNVFGGKGEIDIQLGQSVLVFFNLALDQQ